MCFLRKQIYLKIFSGFCYSYILVRHSITLEFGEISFYSKSNFFKRFTSSFKLIKNDFGLESFKSLSAGNL